MRLPMTTPRISSPAMPGALVTGAGRGIGLEIGRRPRLAVGLTPLLMRDALRRQRSFKRKVEAGKWPPSEYR